MDNISLSYDFGDLFTLKKFNSRLVFTASVQNVFVLTEYEGGDPESPFNFGANFGGNYTAPRIYSLAVNINL